MLKIHRSTYFILNLKYSNIEIIREFVVFKTFVEKRIC